MKFAAIGALALLAMTTGAFAEDYVGGSIKTMEIGGKDVLTDANGMTLYTFDKDIGRLQLLRRLRREVAAAVCRRRCHR